MAESVISDGDVVIGANEPPRYGDGSGPSDSGGDIVFRTGGVERARIGADGVGRGLLGGSQAPVRARIAVIGDSLTSNMSGGAVRLGVELAQKALWGGWFATTGFTLANIQATHLPTVLALTGWQKPNACVVYGGTNDCGAASGAGFVFATSAATHLDICTQLVGAGILPILVKIPPRADFAACNVNVRKWNAYIVSLGALKGWPVLDMYSSVVDTAGAWLSGYTGDNIHMMGPATRVAGIAASQLLSAWFALGSPGYLSRSNNDANNLFSTTAQLFLGTVTGGVAAGWGGLGTGAVFTVVTGDAAIVGNWQTASRPLAASGNAFLHTSPRITTGFAPGDRLAMSCLMKLTAFEANVTQSANMQVSFLDVGGATISALTLVSGSSAGLSEPDVASNAFVYDEAVVPPLCTQIDVSIGVNNAATTTNGSTMQIAQPTLLNLTTLGLA